MFGVVREVRQDVAVARDGSLLFGDISNRVLRLRGGRLTRVATIGFPVEVAIDPRGGFAVASNETRIRRVDAKTGTIESVAGAPVPDFTRLALGLALDTDATVGDDGTVEDLLRDALRVLAGSR